LDTIKQFKFYGECRYQTDRLLHDKYFKDFKGQGISLECGAADGITASATKFFEESLGWKTINIEALPESYEKLIKNRPLSINIHAVLADSEGEAYFQKNTIAPLSSKIVKNDGENTYKIKKTTYKKVIEDLKITYLDLMVLDVEYHETEALIGMEGAKILPDILCVEFPRRSRENSVVMQKVLKLGYTLNLEYKWNKFFKRVL
jgi:FkbM family methyltransferase